MLHEACNTAVNSAGRGTAESLKLVEGLVDTAKQCEVAADALYRGIRGNLDNLIKHGKQLQSEYERIEEEKSKVEDEDHDGPCNDPDCPGHTNH